MIVFREPQRFEVRKASHMVDISLNIEFHLQGGVPGLKHEHGLPVKPEIGLIEFFVKHIVDGLVIELLIRCEEELHDFHGRLVRESKFAVRVRILSPVDCGAAE